MVLVTFNFRYFASAPKVRWRARAGALALGQEPKPPPQLAHTTMSLLEGGEEGRVVRTLFKPLLNFRSVLNPLLNCKHPVETPTCR